MADDTPLRRQYLSLKRKHPDSILFFRLGDFYETFDEDAKLVARELQITLTSRPMAHGERVPMAGVPHHAVEHYLARLMAKGHRVAMAEQLGEPGPKMMEREVLRVLTPGTVVEPGLLEAAHNTYLLALVAAEGRYGLAYIDASTGQFAATELGDAQALVREVHRVGPAECLVLADQLDVLAPLLGDVPLSTADAWMFEPAGCRDTLLSQLEAASLEAFGLGDLPLATRAAGGVLHYLGHTRHLVGDKLPISELRTYRVEGFLTLDQYSR
ncbi:MAG: DNA mismatch repair protein MutS, partial [Chloroflexota bacterium]